VLRLVTRLPAVIALMLSAVVAMAPTPVAAPPPVAPQPTALATPSPPPSPTARPSTAPARSPNDLFQLPLPSWNKHCLGFGSQWRLCDGTVLRSCASGTPWLHTGFDVRTGIQPVRAAANGVIVGYTVDPYFKGGVLIRHQTTFGIVITQYWHVWPRAGFRVGTHVTRGQVFADIANMGSRTHFHFAVFRGDMQSSAWRGALPPTACAAGYPVFPYRFVDPTAFVKAHLPPAV
jgi:murein DD-endopeptidase MepM/ murein hydrolase activator NlpD